MNKRIQIARMGEDLACQYLERKGYEIVDRNLKLSFREIDIIAHDLDETVFVEVKTRTNDFFGQAEESMSDQKINNLKRAVSSYILYKNLDEHAVRIDLVVVNFNVSKKIAKIKHYIDIT